MGAPIADIVEVLLGLTVSITPLAQAFAAKYVIKRKSSLTPRGSKSQSCVSSATLKIPTLSHIASQWGDQDPAIRKWFKQLDDSRRPQDFMLRKG